MSILIDMAMPKSCDECLFADSYLLCDAKRDCPLIELPPHGRLIDADALMENEENISFKDEWHMTVTEAFVSVENIADAPTIIEAEVDDDKS